MTLAYLTNECARHICNGNRTRLRPLPVTIPLSRIKRTHASVAPINRYLESIK